MEQILAMIMIMASMCAHICSFCIQSLLLSNKIVEEQIHKYDQFITGP